MFQLLPNNRDFRSQTRVGDLRYAGVQSISHSPARVGGSGVPRHQEVTQLVSRALHQKLANSCAFLFRGLFAHSTPGLGRRVFTVNVR